DGCKHPLSRPSAGGLTMRISWSAFGATFVALVPTQRVGRPNGIRTRIRCLRGNCSTIERWGFPPTAVSEAASGTHVGKSHLTPRHADSTFAGGSFFNAGTSRPHL